MKKLLLLLSFSLCLLNASELDKLLENVTLDTQNQTTMDKQREADFLSNLSRAKKLLAQTKQSLALEKAKTQRLKKQFQAQKQTIANYNKNLEKSTGSLKNLFSISQQEARDFSSLLQSSMTSSQLKNREKFLESFATSHSIPNIDDMKKFYTLYLQEIIASGKISTYDAPLVDVHGAQKMTSLTRVGLFSAFDAKEYVRYDDALGDFVQLMRQPNSSSSTLIEEYHTTNKSITPILIDPTRGVLFNMLKEKATIKDRINQGGIIGYIILLLGALTLIYAMYKFTLLSSANAKMNKQMKSSDIDISNPLGRILASFEKHKNKDIDTIESKMDTAILKELPEIQSGLPMMKLVAAVAPLLGLLGTVTGMIETFQSITLFGTGDPKLMAGGISQALMTTVLGLVVAIPILFIYNIVHAKSKKIIEILTQQSSVLVAKQLDMLHSVPDEYNKTL